MVRDGFGFKAVTLGMHMLQIDFKIATGDAAGALATADDALAWLTRQEEWLFESEAHRLRGEAFAMGDLAGADLSYSTAIDVARRQHARLFELRATMGRARLWRRQGRTADALASVRTIYDWFTEGFDGTDLGAARTLIDELGVNTPGSAPLPA